MKVWEQDEGFSLNPNSISSSSDSDSWIWGFRVLGGLVMFLMILLLLFFFFFLILDWRGWKALGILIFEEEETLDSM